MNIRDQIKLYDKHKLANSSCYSCGKSTHLYENCPLIHHIPDREFLIKRYLFHEKQIQNRSMIFQRKFRRKFNALINFKGISSKIKDSIYIKENELRKDEEFFDYEKIDEESLLCNENYKNMEENDSLENLPNENEEDNSKNKDNFDCLKFSVASEKNLFWKTNNKIKFEKSEKFLFNQNLKSSTKINSLNAINFTKEKAKNCTPKLFDYSFEIMKDYQHYFVKGNAEILLKKQLNNLANEQRQSILKSLVRRKKTNGLYLQKAE